MKIDNKRGKIKRLKRIELINDKIADRILEVLEFLGKGVLIILSCTILLPIPIIRIIVKKKIRKLEKEVK